MAEQRALRVAIGVGRPDADDIRVVHVVLVQLHSSCVYPTREVSMKSLGQDR